MSLSSDGALTSAAAAPQRAGIPRGGEVKVPLVYQRCRSSLWYDSGVERFFSFFSPVLHQILSPSASQVCEDVSSWAAGSDSRMACAAAALCISDATHIHGDVRSIASCHLVAGGGSVGDGGRGVGGQVGE